MLTYKIQGGLVVDGTGAPATQADIVVQGDTILSVGRVTDGDVPTIDACGLTVCPGFIDSHSHVDVGVFHPLMKQQRIVQGITTDVVGHCGASTTPIHADYLEEARKIYFELTGTGMDYDWPWINTTGYLKTIRESGLPGNMAFLVGHGTLRSAVMGVAPRAADAGEVAAMQTLLAACLEQGAIGLSFGLSFIPGCYADTKELTALAETCRRHGAMICAHRRSEGEWAVESVREMLDIARETGVRMHISHLKTVGEKNWGKSETMLSDIEAARADGADVMFDVYPYTAGYTQLCDIFPRWVLEAGYEQLPALLGDPAQRDRIRSDIESDAACDSTYRHATARGIRVIQCGDKTVEGQTLADVAAARGDDAISCAMDIVRDCGVKTMMIAFMQDENELARIIKHPLAMIMSDGAPSMFGTHQRYMGTYARMLDCYVKQTGLLTLEEAVHKFTGMTARWHRLDRRGIIAPGMRADFAILDWERFADRCSYEAPLEKAQGVEYVIVNGVIAAVRGEYTQTQTGRVLTRS